MVTTVLKGKDAYYDETSKKWKYTSNNKPVRKSLVQIAKNIFNR